MSTALQAALTFKTRGLQAGLQAILWLMLLLIQLPLHSEIHRIYRFSEAQKQFEMLDTESLVVFDVDRVLIENQDAILQAHNSALFRTLLLQAGGHLTQGQLNSLVSGISFQSRPKLIEQEIADLILMLEQKNIRVIALTATSIGSIAKIGSIQDWRIKRLQELGLTFSFQNTPFHSFSELIGQGPSPVFKGGILFSATYSKGSVLKAFLQHINWKPSQVLFFDDLFINVSTVNNEMTALGVEKVCSFQYLGANSLAPVDLEVAKAQIRHLVETGQWLTEKQLKSQEVSPVK